jgi:hypothetical protein
LAGPPSSASDGALAAISPNLKVSIADMLRGVKRDSDGLPFGAQAELAKAISDTVFVIEA